MTIDSTSRTARPETNLLARILTEAFAPIVLIFVMLLIVAIHGAGLVRGTMLGLIAAVFAGGLPYAVILFRIRRGHLGNHHLTRRQERPLMLLIGIASLAAGTAILAGLHAPRELYALVVAMLTGVAIALVITLFWKISIHAASCAGSVAVLAVLFGPLALLGVVVVGAVCWSRVALTDHTVAQVIAGALVGAAVAAIVMTLLS